MARYRYEVRNERGEQLSGQCEADQAADVERSLREQGWELLSVVPIEGGEPGDHREPALSQSETELVVATVADLGTAQIPLAAGLRAAAAETPHRRIARALRRIAHDAEQGKSLDAILRERGAACPAHVRGLVQVASRTGRMGTALDELVDHDRTVRDLFWSVVGAVAYPLIVLVISIILLSIVPLTIVPQFKRMFEEFQLQLPWSTEMLIAGSDVAAWLADRAVSWVIAGAFVVFLLSYFGIPGVLGAGKVRRFLWTTPVIGPLWQWRGAAEFSHLLGVLVEHGVPLPEALRLTADGTRDPSIREISLWLSADVQRGQKLSDRLAAIPSLPATLVPLVRWGERTGELAESLRCASEMYLVRIRLRAMLLRVVSPPVVFILILLGVGFAVIGLFTPLISLISSLS